MGRSQVGGHSSSRGARRAISTHFTPEAVLEGYRQAYRAATQPERLPGHASLLGDVLVTAQQDGKIPADVDLPRLALAVESAVPDGVRHWVAGLYGDLTFSEAVAQNIEALIRGHHRKA